MEFSNCFPQKEIPEFLMNLFQPIRPQCIPIYCHLPFNSENKLYVIDCSIFIPQLISTDKSRGWNVYITVDDFSIIVYLEMFPSKK